MEEITFEQYGEAIVELLTLAESDVGGARAAAQVLLGTYNSNQFHLDITDLCLLDSHYYQAALTVIRGRVELSTEPHILIQNGSQNFNEVWQQWRHLQISQRGKEE